MLILAILVQIAAVVLRVVTDGNWIVFGPVFVASAVLAVMGLLRLGAGLGYSSTTVALFVVLAFVPLASILMMGLLSEKATKALRAGGYQVGFFGARKR